VLALDLTSAELLRALGISAAELTADDLSVCQALADIAAESGFEAIIGPSAARAADTTLAVFGAAIDRTVRDVADRGVASAS
jgi:2-keto-4-pentenoate hydratase